MAKESSTATATTTASVYAACTERALSPLPALQGRSRHYEPRGIMTCTFGVQEWGFELALLRGFESSSRCACGAVQCLCFGGHIWTCLCIRELCADSLFLLFRMHATMVTCGGSPAPYVAVVLGTCVQCSSVSFGDMKRKGGKVLYWTQIDNQTLVRSAVVLVHMFMISTCTTAVVPLSCIRSTAKCTV